MDQKKLIKKLIRVSKDIANNRKSEADYIFLSEKYIQEQADVQKISFDDMLENIKYKLNIN